jgi:hypothetical protein
MARLKSHQAEIGIEDGGEYDGSVPTYAADVPVQCLVNNFSYQKGIREETEGALCEEFPAPSITGQTGQIRMSGFVDSALGAWFLGLNAHVVRVTFSEDGVLADKVIEGIVDTSGYDLAAQSTQKQSLSIRQIDPTGAA